MKATYRHFVCSRRPPRGYAFRPQWNVAGVDYHVGVPEGFPFDDWRTSSQIPSGWYNPATGLIRLDSGAPANVVFYGIDFSKGVGAAIYNPAGGSSATSITLIDCNFNAPFYGQSGYPLLDQNGANVIIKSCTFDALAFLGTGWNAFLATNGNLTLLYNWFKNSPSQILQWNAASSGNAVIAKYKFYDDMDLTSGAHRNYLEVNANSVSNIGYNVSFNTTYQSRSCNGQGGEGFQIYSNGTGVVLTNPVIANNTMIARLGADFPNAGLATMSSLLHGTASGTTISGTGQNNNNYFDLRGALDAYYSGSMIGA
jgi:hypothetical protein